MTDTEKSLYAKAKAITGREVEVQQTKDGRFIVLYMCFGKKPPPKGATPKEALRLFVDYMEANRPVDPGTEEDFTSLQKQLEVDQLGDEA